MGSRSDNFSRSDGSLGTPSDGGSDWVLSDSSTWVVDSNAARCTQNAAIRVAYLETTDISSMAVAAKIATLSTSVGVVARCLGHTDFVLFQWASGFGYRLFQRSSGTTWTQLSADVSGTPSVGQVLRLVCSGGTLGTVSAFVDGTQIFSPVSMAFVNGQTKGGLYTGNDTTSRFDDFTITDAAGSTLAGTITLDAFTFAGDVATGALSQLSSGLTLDAFALSGFLGLAPGRIDSNPFKNWTGTLLPGVTIPRLTFLRLSDMTTVLQLTDQTTAGDGVLTVTNAAFTPGTTYLVVAASVDGASLGAEIYTAT